MVQKKIYLILIEKRQCWTMHVPSIFKLHEILFSPMNLQKARAKDIYESSTTGWVLFLNACCI